MWNEPSKEKLSKIPRMYETENIPLKDKEIHLHFFIFDCDWFIAEFDGKDTFFGFAILNNNFINAEWGHVSFAELKSININGFQIDCETPWNTCEASDIEKICKAQEWSIY
jgi:hypothetical protein